MCDYCNDGNKEEDFYGGDGVVYGKMYVNENPCHHIFIEHFRNEVHKIKVNYCPQCGRNLTK